MTGKITKINGSVIEVGFADKGLPKINAALRLDADGHARYAEDRKSTRLNSSHL